MALSGISVSLIAAGLCAATGAYLVFRSRSRIGLANPVVEGGFRGSFVPAALIPAGSRRIPVYRANELIEKLELGAVIKSIQNRSGLIQENFASDCQPVIDAFAELVQLFPASESHHHANPGGLLVHTLEAINHALTIRQGFILPPGAAAEDIGKLQHRWTFAVIIATLLHDVGKAIADFEIDAVDAAGREFVWNPVAGSLVQCAATGYSLTFNANRKYGDHAKLPVILLQVLIPRATMQWLSYDARLLTELTQYLSGSDAPENAFQIIVSRADGESVKHNLLHGSRVRFTAAKIVPLIERVLDALRQMMENGGALPLNRAGAAGWIYEGEAWFVSKRLVDEIRAHLVSTGQGQGFPGVDKNERLFDIFQDYGVCVSHPISHKAIWKVQVDLAEGWTGKFTVIRIPLGKILASATSFPSAMLGSIRVLESVPTNEPMSPDAASQIGDSATADTAFEAQLETAIEVTDSVDDEPQTTSPKAAEHVDSSSKTSDQSTDDAKSNADDEHAHREGSAVGPKQAEHSPDHRFLRGSDSAQATNYHDAGANKPLENLELTGLETTGESTVSEAIKADPFKTKRVQLGGAVTASVPPMKPHNINGKRPKETPQIAVQFMLWVQQGVASGELSFNNVKAQVHFVTIADVGLGNADSPERCMALVSPIIFKDFLKHSMSDGFKTPDMDYRALQQEIVKAGWHVVINPGNINILKFEVQAGSESAERKSLLSCVVIRDPDRFVNPVPPDNPMIAYSHLRNIPTHKANNQAMQRN